MVVVVVVVVGVVVVVVVVVVVLMARSTRFPSSMTGMVVSIAFGRHKWSELHGSEYCPLVGSEGRKGKCDASEEVS